MSVRVVFITGDPLRAALAGPGIRSYNLAKELAKFCEVKLFSTSAVEITSESFRVQKVRPGNIVSESSWADVIITQGFVLGIFPELASLGKRLVVDVYDPIHLEQITDNPTAIGGASSLAIRNTIGALTQSLRVADFVVCASEKQRDFWLGYLSALGRVSPANYRADSSFRKLIDVIPFGIEANPPVRTGLGIIGRFHGISRDDPILIWGGGIYNWFDPLTLIRSVGNLVNRIPNLRLIFLGVRHPNSDVQEAEMVNAAQKLSDELGLTEKNVFFNTDWVPYQERGNYFLDSHVGVSTHFDQIETTFSFRTRILDYLWSGLPVICTQGDTLAQIIKQESWGITVPAGNPEALSEAIEKLLGDRSFRDLCLKNIQKGRKSFEWELLAKPLVDYCLDGDKAPDLANGLVKLSTKFATRTRTEIRIRMSLSGFRRKVFERRNGRSYMGDL